MLWEDLDRREVVLLDGWHVDVLAIPGDEDSWGVLRAVDGEAGRVAADEVVALRGLDAALEEPAVGTVE